MKPGDDAANVKPVPDGASVVIPRLICRDPAAEIDFCTDVFRAVEGVRRPGPDGKVAHAMITIGPAMVMIESEWPAMRSRAPQPDGSSSVVLYVYVADVDEAVERAVARGAKILMPLTDQFWGDRTAWIVDPAGHVWTIATRIEETTEAQRQERLARLNAKSTTG
jgi:PhnB protein